ncbi:MAG: tetratricopeptide repeat protein [Bryobacteraceae bacterium]
MIRCVAGGSGLLLLLFAIDLRAASGTPFSQEEIGQIRQINRDLYSLEYGKARHLCRAIIAAAPEDPLGYVYLARTQWLEHMNREGALSLYRYSARDFFSNPAKYGVGISAEGERQFRDVSRQAIDLAKAELGTNPRDLRARYLLGVAYQNLATFEATVKHSWWATFANGDKGVRHHRQVEVGAPEFYDPRLSAAMYQYVAASIPWRLRWFTILLGRSGSKTRGKELLELVAANAVLVADDVRTLLAVLYTRDGEFDKALEKLLRLHQDYPANFLVHIEIGDTRMRMKQPNEAIAVYQTVLAQAQANGDRSTRFEAGVVHNRLGLAQRAANDLPAAEKSFLAAIAHAASSDRTRAQARLELGKTLDLEGRRGEAIDQYRQLLASAPPASLQREAESLLKRPYVN